MKSVSSGYGGVSKSFRIESITKYTITTINTRWEATQRGYVGKIHQTDSQNSNTTTYSGRQLYHLQFSLQSASPETFRYTLLLLSIKYDKTSKILFDENYYICGISLRLRDTNTPLKETRKLVMLSTYNSLRNFTPRACQYPPRGL